MSKRILKQYCTKNFRKIRHRKGFGVHSPFAYNLITKVIEETYSYYAYQQIEEVWHTRVCNQLTQDIFNDANLFRKNMGACFSVWSTDFVRI